MSSSNLNEASTAILKAELSSLYKIGGVAALLQLVAILTYAVVTAVLGPKPTSATDYFAIHQSSLLAAFLRGDILLLVMIGLYLGTFPALYAALRHISPVYTSLATLFTVMAVLGCFVTESSFSLLYLGNQYAIATEAQRLQFIAAGEAIIASDMWNGTAAYLGGILLQGSGVMISLIMLRSKDFSKVTAYSGLVANALDLTQHLLHPFAPSISAPIAMFMSLFYFIWFPMLGRDLWRLGRRSSGEET